MATLTKEQVDQAGEALTWLTMTHAKVLAAFRASGKDAGRIGEATGLHRLLVTNLLNRKAYLHGENARESFRFAKLPDEQWQKWMQYSATVPSARWWQFILFPDVLELFCECQRFLVALDLKSQDWRSLEMIAHCVEPEHGAEFYALLRFRQDGFAFYEADPSARERVMNALADLATMRQRMRRYERHLQTLRQSINTQMKVLRQHADGRTMTMEELAKFVGYEPLTVRSALNNSLFGVQSYLKIYQIMCEKRQVAPILQWPVLPMAVLEDPVGFSTAEEEQTTVPADEAESTIRVESTSQSPAQTESGHRLQYKLSLWRYLTECVPRDWSKATVLATALAVGDQSTEEILLEMMDALQGRPEREGTLDAMIGVILDRAAREQIPLPEVLVPSARLSDVERIMSLAKGVIALLQEKHSLLTLALPSREESELSSVLYDLYTSVEVFTSGSPDKLAEIIAESKRVLSGQNRPTRAS